MRGREESKVKGRKVEGLEESDFLAGLCESERSAVVVGEDESLLASGAIEHGMDHAGRMGVVGEENSTSGTMRVSARIPEEPEGGFEAILEKETSDQ